MKTLTIVRILVIITAAMLLNGCLATSPLARQAARMLVDRMAFQVAPAIGVRVLDKTVQNATTPK
jgi:hypothetical protein